jgi:hypothetical protein
MYWLALGCALLQQVEQLARHQRAGVRLLQRTTLAHDILCRVRALDAVVARRRPPVLHSLHLLVEERILSRPGLCCFREQLERVAGQRCRHGWVDRLERRARHATRRGGERAEELRCWLRASQRSALARDGARYGAQHCD